MALTDEELVEVLQNHTAPMESTEISLLIYRYSRIIRIKASKLRKSADLDADDLYQEGFLGLLDAVKGYNREKGRFQSFAEVCIVNRMKNALNKASKGYIAAEDYDFEQLTDEAALTEDYVILKERNSELYEKLEKLLSKKELSVLSLYLEGYTYKQIAARLSISLKSVDNSLSRSKQKLKQLF
ncbi:MAG: sigma-70 family RNA polymerase sigma factor [Ruminiclostridium sp.]|nr:sigma-70 family RNA polymerase sigma factor [Ruminiclostridium sp.]